MASRPLIVERTFKVRSSPDQLWDVVTDTEALNRAAGLARLSIEPLRDETAARFLVKTRLGGFPVEYEELPFEWVKPKRFAVLRRMRKGPVYELRMSFALEADPTGGTRVGLKLDLDPRFGWMRPFLKISASGGLSDLEAQITRADQALATGAKDAGAAFHGAKHGGDGAALRAAGARLAELADRDLAGELTRLVGESNDFDLSRIRPYEIADRWKRLRKEVLKACLAGVRAGLLELRWELICPSCRTAAASMTSLAELEEHGTCQLCDLSFGLDLDESVEVVFSPAAGVREVDRGPYCIGGPARTPHVLAQTVLAAGGTGELEAPPAPGVVRVFLRGGDSLRVEVATDAPPTLRLDPYPGAWPKRAIVAPAGRIVIDNTGHPERHAKLEQTEGQRLGAPARDVAMLPAFRRDFSTELLRRDQALKVARVALLFTDLTGSTALYAREGDARAFRLVLDHLDVVRDVVEKLGGTVVKTIGDAVMAAFPSDLDAVRAGWGALNALEAWRAAEPSRAGITLKLGVHAGPCYVVTANGALDYFGQTVNVAARLHGEARPGELVMMERLAAEAMAAGLLVDHAVTAPETVTLKGVEGEVSIVRATLVKRSRAARRTPERV